MKIFYKNKFIAIQRESPFAVKIVNLDKVVENPAIDIKDAVTVVSNLHLDALVETHLKRAFVEENFVSVMFLCSSRTPGQFELILQQVNLDLPAGPNPLKSIKLVENLAFNARLVEVLGFNYFQQSKIGCYAYKVCKKLALDSHELVLGCCRLSNNSTQASEKFASSFPGKGLWIKDQEWNSKIYTRAKFWMSSGRVFCLVTVSFNQMAIFVASLRKFVFQYTYRLKKDSRFTAPGCLVEPLFPCVIRKADPQLQYRYYIYRMDLKPPLSMKIKF